MKRWYAARTQAGLARIAERELGRPYGDRPAFETVLPLGPRGSPIFGPYIFIEFDLDQDYWQPINGVRGITRLLPLSCPSPLPLPIGFVEELRGRSSLDEESAQELIHHYRRGDPAIVASGAFEGHIGKFERRYKGFINLSLLLFNRTCEVPVPAHQVKPYRGSQLVG